LTATRHVIHINVRSGDVVGVAAEDSECVEAVFHSFGDKLAARERYRPGDIENCSGLVGS
jgi:hypothetical protein